MKFDGKVAILYFSGTGNTAFVVKEIEKNFAKNDISYITFNMEAFDETQIEALESADVLFFGYPVHGSMAPMIVWEFVRKYASHFEGKKGLVFCTQWFFSGDGGAYMARILKKCDVDVLAIEHFKMNNNISDFPLFGVKNGSENSKMLTRVTQEIELFVLDFINGKYVKIGNSFGSMLLGAFQRIPFSKWEQKLSKNVRIDTEKCTLCNLCVEQCPTKNLFNEGAAIEQNGKCTLCYRCVNQCPVAAISIMGKNKPNKQYIGLE